MRRMLIPAALAAGALVLAACGSSDDDSGDVSSGASEGADAASATISVLSVDGIGDVLVDDATGMALYTAEQESDGEVLCVDTCEAFWAPLEAGDGEPTSESEAAELGVTTRPDGTRQVTAGGQPLYTFAQDSPGEVTGDGFSDEFGGQQFTWHAALADGASTTTSAGESTGGGYGY
jgi:predicted lipoprotein with Yx(FWY)xxD motif